MGDEIIVPDFSWNNQRLNWNERWMCAAIVAAARSSCLYIHTGAVIVKDKRELANGYNGPPPGFELSCSEFGFCEKRTNKRGIGRCIGNHAETNGLQQIDWQDKIGADIYSLFSPCYRCSKEIAQARLNKVYYLKKYTSTKEDEHPDLPLEYLRQAGIISIELEETPPITKTIETFFPDGLKCPEV